MTRVSTPFVAAIALLAVICAQPAAADTIDIDLNDFYADATVTVAVDGSTATIAEDSFFLYSSLLYEPAPGDDPLIEGGSGVSLHFDYAFSEGSSDEDEFSATLYDVNAGFFDPPPHELFVTDTGSGSVSWSLGSLGSTTLGLEFALYSLGNDSALSSTVTISNLRLETPSTPGSPVPEPATVTLMSAALAGFVAHRRRKRFAA